MVSIVCMLTNNNLLGNGEDFGKIVKPLISDKCKD